MKAEDGGLVDIVKKFLAGLLGGTIERAVRKELRRAAVVAIGCAVIIFGIFYVSDGVVEALSMTVSRWAADLIVGLFLALVGLLSLLGSLRR